MTFSVPLPGEVRQRFYMLLSLFLQYPSDSMLAARAGLADVARSVSPPPVRRVLEPFLSYWEREPADTLRQHYVSTFDLAARSTLYLSYYLFGDRRDRGRALLRVKQAYEAAGLRMITEELPDYLPVILECAAVVPDVGAAILADYRPALELLYRALAEDRSPYASVLGALRLTLPPLDARARKVVARWSTEGPPGERVGLEAGPAVELAWDPPAGDTPGFPASRR